MFLDDQRDTVFRFLVATVGFDDAEDCFQDTFVSALRAYPRWRTDRTCGGRYYRALQLGHVPARKRRPLPVEELPEIPVAAEQSVNGSSDVWSAAWSSPRKQAEALLYRFAAEPCRTRTWPRSLGTSEEAARQRVSEDHPGISGGLAVMNHSKNTLKERCPRTARGRRSGSPSELRRRASWTWPTRWWTRCWASRRRPCTKRGLVELAYGGEQPDPLLAELKHMQPNQ